MLPILTPVLGISAQHHRDSCPAKPGGASLEAGCWFLGADEAPLEETGRSVTAGNHTPRLNDTPFLPAEKSGALKGAHSSPVCQKKLSPQSWVYSDASYAHWKQAEGPGSCKGARRVQVGVWSGHSPAPHQHHLDHVEMQCSCERTRMHTASCCGLGQDLMCVVVRG